MAEFSKEFLEKTIKVWQPYSSEPLSLEDAREIAENITELFYFLAELDKKYGKKEKKS
ncbi:MAG: hypothetical protein N2Z79_02830 [Candidatus Omnitrophica bacterium]|nr:hypothetical protein [Candidatus Omnitrophota bacterium]